MNRKLKIFFTTLMAVLCVGVLAIMIYGTPDKDVPATQQPVPIAEQPAQPKPEKQVIEVAATSTPTPTPEPTPTPGPEELYTTLGEGISAEGEYFVKTAEEGEISLAFTGDILLDPGYAIYTAYRNRGGALDKCISQDLLDEMRAADVLMVNNEFPFSDRGTPAAGKTYTFRAAPESVNILKEMGVDIAGVANNHAFDYGMDAFLDTMDILENAGIPYVGGGHDISEAARPIYLHAADMKIAVVAATQIERMGNPHSIAATEDTAGMLRCWPSVDQLVEVLKEAKENSDYVILFIHWGTEREVDPDWCQNQQLPELIASGVDLIIGSHPHILQPISVANGVPVVYSTGNFWFNSKSLDSCLIEVKLSDGGLKSLRFVPCLQAGSAVKLLHDGEAARLIEYMRSISPNVTIDDEGYVSW
ncbi:MAG: CapA family protein [Lachnospiraceae bacterium]|nr:CapA family protein [Lachnospiraceae bacterium]